MSAAGQFETFPLSVPFTLQPAEHPQLKGTSTQHAREFHTCDWSTGRRGNQGNCARGSRILAFWPGEAQVAPASRRQRICSPKQPGGGGSGAWDPILQQLRCPNPGPYLHAPQWWTPQTLQHWTQQRRPSPFQALRHPHTLPAVAQPVNQGISDMAKGARHANAPGQDIRDTGSLALKTIEAQEATTGARGNTSEKGCGQWRARILAI